MTPTLPPGLVPALESVLSTGILEISRISGGDIHEAYVVRTTHQRYFLKANHSEGAPAIFDAEVRGLETISAWVTTPQVVDRGTLESGGAFLLMSYHPPGQPSDRYWSQAGHDLATLHAQTSPRHGNDQPGFLGLIPYPSTHGQQWPEVYLQGYLEPMVRQMEQRKALEGRFRELWSGVRDCLPSILDQQSPSLLHGDLWSGNLYCAEGGVPLFIDPSVRYGHREVDLAMTTLFGGFPPEFYAAYREVWPEDPLWPLREAIYQLYPMFAHVAMFGLVYEDQTMDLMDRILLQSWPSMG